MAEVLSNVGNKYNFAKEDTYGTIPGAPVILDLGHVQSISVDEAENSEGVSSMNSLHTAVDIEDGLYNLTGTITTLATHASMEVILEAIFGAIAADTPGAGQYTITTDPVHSDDLSYFLKFNTTTGKTMQMVGLCVTGGEITVTRDGDVEITLNYMAQKMTPATESLSVTANAGALYKGLDGVVTLNGTEMILSNFTITTDWNVTEEDGRGIESYTGENRRVIQRVIRHELTLTGNFESEMDDNLDTGYVAERSNVPIVLTLDRGASNTHVFTIAASKTDTRSRDLTNDSTTKKITGNFIGLDVTIVGDEFA